MPWPAVGRRLFGHSDSKTPQDSRRRLLESEGNEEGNDLEGGRRRDGRAPEYLTDSTGFSMESLQRADPDLATFLNTDRLSTFCKNFLYGLTHTLPLSRPECAGNSLGPAPARFCTRQWQRVYALKPANASRSTSTLGESSGSLAAGHSGLSIWLWGAVLCRYRHPASASCRHCPQTDSCVSVQPDPASLQ